MVVIDQFIAAYSQWNLIITILYRVSVSKPNALALGCRHRPLVLDQNFFLT